MTERNPTVPGDASQMSAQLRNPLEASPVVRNICPQEMPLCGKLTAKFTVHDAETAFASNDGETARASCSKGAAL